MSSGTGDFPYNPYPYWPAQPYVPKTPVGVTWVVPQGCICPPTSEQTCQNPTCPRRGQVAPAQRDMEAGR